MLMDILTFIIPVFELLTFIWVCILFVKRQKEYSFKNINSNGVCFIITIILFMLVPVLDLISHFHTVRGFILFSARLCLNILAVIYLQTFLYKVSMTKANEEITKKINFFDSNKRTIAYFNVLILMFVPIAAACIEGYKITYRYYWMLALIYWLSTIYLLYLRINTKIKNRHWIFFTGFNAIYWSLYWLLGVNYYHHGDSFYLPFIVAAKILRIFPLFFVSEGRFSDSCVYDVEER